MASNHAAFDCHYDTVSANERQPTLNNKQRLIVQQSLNY